MVKRGESYYLTPAEVALFFYRLPEKHMANLNEELRQAVQDFRRRVQGLIAVHKALTGAAPDLQATVAQVADLDVATKRWSYARAGALCRRRPISVCAQIKTGPPRSQPPAAAPGLGLTEPKLKGTCHD